MKEKNAVNVLSNVKTIMDKHKITFWLARGTLLGLIRENAFLSWDSDIDLYSLETEINKFKETIKDFENNGFKVCTSYKKFEVQKYGISCSFNFFTLEKENKVLKHIGPRMHHDKFWAKVLFYLILNEPPLFYSQRRSIVFFSNLPLPLKEVIYSLVYFMFKKSGAFYIRYILPLEYILPLKSISFYGMKLNVPNMPDKYLEYVFGNWKIPKKDFPHAVTNETYLSFKGTTNKVLIVCPKCKKEYVMDNPHKKGDNSGPIITMNLTCKNCENEIKEDIFVIGSILKNIGESL